MSKTLIVSTDLEKQLFEQVLLPQIQNGFWKSARPFDHGQVWDNVTVEVGTNLGPTGFSVLRNYNFVNPEFFTKFENQLLEVARQINPDATIKLVKRSLIHLNRIVGSRIKEVGGHIIKLPRGRKQPTQFKIDKSKTSTRKMMANIVEAPIVEEETVV